MERCIQNSIFQYSSIPTLHFAHAAEISLSNLQERFSVLRSAA
jgi:hypothetical protein